MAEKCTSELLDQELARRIEHQIVSDAKVCVFPKYLIAGNDAHGTSLLSTTSTGMFSVMEVISLRN